MPEGGAGGWDTLAEEMVRTQVVEGHGCGWSAVGLHLVVHAAHLLVGDADGMCG